MFEMIEEIIAPPEKPEFERVLLQTSTALRDVDSAYRVLMGDYDRDGKPDIYVIHTGNSGTNKADVDILSGASKYASFILHTTTTLGAHADPNVEFVLGDYDRDGIPDLYVLTKGAMTTDVHILSGATKYAKLLLSTETGLSAIDSTYSFAIGDDDRDSIPDIYAIKKSKTGTHKTEVHILGGASNYTQFILHNGTGLGETKREVEFAVGDYDQDGQPDLYAINKRGAGAAKIELNVLSGATSYSQFILNIGTGLDAVDDSFTFGIGDYNGDGKPDLYAIKLNNTVSKTMEITILDAQR